MAKGIKAPAAAFEQYLRDNDLDGCDNSEVARRLDVDKIGIDRTLIVKARKGETLAVRSMWKLWVVTGRKVKKLRPKGLTPLQEWMFGKGWIDKDLVRKLDIPRNTIASYLYDGAEPGEKNREKLYALTKLSVYAPPESEKAAAVGEKSPVPPKPPATPSDSLPDDNGVLDRLNHGELWDKISRLEAEVAELAARKEPSGSELLAKMLEAAAVFLRQSTGATSPEKKAAKADAEQSVSPGDTIERLHGLLLSIETELENLAKTSEDDRARLRDLLEPQRLLRLSSGIGALTKETNFQSWLESRVGL